MTNNYFRIKSFGSVLLLATLAFASCAREELNEEPTVKPDVPTETPAAALTTVNLTSFAGDASRVSYPVDTRAEAEVAANPLTVVASIANPSTQEGYLVLPEGRYLSASCVYYNAPTNTYYVTYHMQGNNYNTDQINEIGGAIQSFKFNENGEVFLGEGFRAANPDKEDFDFNHLFFDETGDGVTFNPGTPRFIVAGHKWNVPSSYTGDEPYAGKRDNTRAIVGEFDPLAATLTYATIKTAEKAYDADGKSLGYTDARDANCVVRVMGYPYYCVATRKGFAVLSADKETMFQPVINRDNDQPYFVPTPGSAKFIWDNYTVGSGMNFLYLAENKSADAYTTASKANMATFQVATGKANSFLGLMNPDSPWTTYYNADDLDIASYPKQVEMPEAITPVDGKNAMSALSYYEYYVPLGVNGFFYKFQGANSYKNIEGVLKFGNRPVNCVVADQAEFESGHDGFIYVANGARLTILHRKTFEEVAYFNLSKDEAGNEVAASANFITVTKGPENNWAPRDRYITVAFGQAGVKVFKFTPSVLPKKTVWEKELQ